MEPKIGDRVSIDAKKVGQARRAGVVKARTKGIAGTRYEIAWDDGSRTMIAPGAGVLLVEGPAKTKKKKASPKR